MLAEEDWGVYLVNRVKSVFNKIPGVFFGITVLFVFFSIFARGFFSEYNILILLKDCCLLINISLGVSLCILSGRNNISVGALMSLCGVITGLLLTAGAHFILAILGGILTGMLIGAISGYLIMYQDFDYWVVTYAFMGISQGLALVLSGGNTVSGFPVAFRFLTDGKILGVYTIIWVTLIICIIMIFLSFKTQFGYNIYSIGGSQQSAKLAGINVRKTVFAVYTIAGVMAAFSGIMLASKSNSASPIGGAGYEFDAIAAVLIGGTTFDGGIGKITGTILGAMLMKILRNGLNLIGLSSFWQTFIIGLIVMIIIVIDTLGQRHRKSVAMRRVYKDNE